MYTGTNGSFFPLVFLSAFLDPLSTVRLAQSFGNGLPQRCLFPANELAGNCESHFEISPVRLLLETLKSEIEEEEFEEEDGLTEFRSPVNELDSSRRVNKPGSRVSSVSGISPENELCERSSRRRRWSWDIPVGNAPPKRLWDR